MYVCVCVNLLRHALLAMVAHRLFLTAMVKQLSAYSG